MNLTPLFVLIMIIPAAIFIAAWYVFPRKTGRLLIAAERRRNGMHSRFIQFGGASWHYLEAGQGSPLLALHGIVADADHWTRLAGLLRQKFHIIAPDLPGFGCSSPPANGAYTLADQVNGLHQFVTELGLKDFFLAGNSMGGQLAAAYATRHPGHVMGLCLLSPSGVIGAHFSPVMKAVVREEHNPLVVRSSDDFDQLIRTCFCAVPWIPRPLRKLLLDRKVLLENNTRAAFDDIRFFSNSLESFAASIHQPCLILWGKNDRVLDVSGASILARLISGSKLVVLDKTGHLPMLEKPALCAQLIQEFVDGLDVGENNSA